MAQEFVALGRAGSDAYIGLETFPNPGVARVELVSDELTAVCPITNQPDFYTATIAYRPVGRCLESKSLKIYLSRFHDQGMFCEALTVQHPGRGRCRARARRQCRRGLAAPEGARRDHDHRLRLIPRTFEETHMHPVRIVLIGAGWIGREHVGLDRRASRTPRWRRSRT